MTSRSPRILRSWTAPALGVAMLALTGCADELVAPEADVLSQVQVETALADGAGEPGLVCRWCGKAKGSTSKVYTYPSGPDQVLIDGASASIVRTRNSVGLKVKTHSLMPRHAYTLWVVIFNQPGACATAPCTANDLFNPDAKPDMLYGAGRVSSRSGTVTLAGRTRVGDVSGSVQAPVGLLSNGLIDPYGAEIHVIVHDHGPVIRGFMPDMIRSLAGGCTDPGIPEQGAPSPWNDYALSPEYGGEFGQLGPNACSSVQVSILTP